MVPPGVDSNPAFIKKKAFRSVKRRLIEVYEFGDSERCVLVIGGIHGDEGAGVVLAGSLLKYLMELSRSDLQSKVVLMPVANPDGWTAGTRCNAHRIDINRNFPTENFRGNWLTQRYNPGTTAASEAGDQSDFEDYPGIPPGCNYHFSCGSGLR